MSYLSEVMQMQGGFGTCFLVFKWLQYYFHLEAYIWLFELQDRSEVISMLKQGLLGRIGVRSEQQIF